MFFLQQDPHQKFKYLLFLKLVYLSFGFHLPIFFLLFWPGHFKRSIQIKISSLPLDFIDIRSEKFALQAKNELTLPVSKEITLKNESLLSKSQSHEEKKEKIIQKINKKNNEKEIKTKATAKNDCKVNTQIAINQMREIQNLIKENWQLPYGIGNGYKTIVFVSVSNEGKVISCRFEKTAIAVFDISIEMAILKMKFPSWAWGKKLEIMFDLT